VMTGRWRISTGRGQKPAWVRDGRALFYTSAQSMMRVAIQGTTPADWSTPEKLFEGPFLLPESPGTFDVALDGRFLMSKDDTEAAARTLDTLIVVQNWFEELRHRVPAN